MISDHTKQLIYLTFHAIELDHDCFSSSGVTSMSVARSRVHCSSVIGLSLIKYLPISSAVSFRRVRAGLCGLWGI